MKRLILYCVFIMAVAATFSSVTAAADHGPKDLVQCTDTVTVDSQYTGNWDPVDSFVVVRDTAGTQFYEVSGMVQLGAYDWLYMNIGNDSANRVDSATSATTGQTNENGADTCIIGGFTDLVQKVWLHFSCIRPDSGAAATDTFYINMATGMSNKPIKIKNLVIRRY